jgi:hypothetical protein
MYPKCIAVDTLQKGPKIDTYFLRDTSNVTYTYIYQKLIIVIFILYITTTKPPYILENWGVNFLTSTLMSNFGIQEYTTQNC